MKYITVFFSLNISLFMAGCDPMISNKLCLANNSNDTIFYKVSLCVDSITSFPIKEDKGKVNYLYSNILGPKKEYCVPAMGEWRSLINRCKDSTISIFFFNNDLIRTANKDSILRYQLYSKKKKMSIKDLEKLNWRVAYP